LGNPQKRAVVGQVSFQSTIRQSIRHLFF
jgi:hypothetical protein